MASLSEQASNVIENLACRLARRNGGRIAPHHLLPHLPISLGLVKESLDDMCDGVAVHVDESGDIIAYTFSAYAEEGAASASVFDADTCISCGQDLPGSDPETLCDACSTLLNRELAHLAEKTGWPAEAVYEHDILYHASRQAGPVFAEELASASRYTLRRMRRKLELLVQRRYASEELDPQRALMRYTLPDLRYPRDRFRRNMAVIRSYPASVMEEVQLKVVRILISLGLLFLGMLILAFCGFPFPLLVLGAILVGPILALVIWFHRDKVQDT